MVAVENVYIVVRLYLKKEVNKVSETKLKGIKRVSVCGIPTK